MLESPYSGDIDRNIRYLGLIMAESGVVYGECAYASHAYMTQHPRKKDYFVSDYDAKWNLLDRDQAIARSQAMRHRADVTVFYTDLGWSKGMLAAKSYCQEQNLAFVERKLDIPRLAKSFPYLTEKFCRAILDKQPYKQFLD